LITISPIYTKVWEKLWLGWILPPTVNFYFLGLKNRVHFVRC
jgi:hypothetical protein